VAVALVVLLGQAAAWVHAAATPHVTCLEHGESVHLSVRSVTGPAAGDHGVATVAATNDSEAHGHEHCGLQGQRTVTGGTPARDSRAASFGPVSSPAIVAATATAHLLRFAPKTSPPRAPIV
jgi:hypothetical protein